MEERSKEGQADRGRIEREGGRVKGRRVMDG